MNERETWDTIIQLLGAYGTFILLVKILPETVAQGIHKLQLLREKKCNKKASREKYPPHICDHGIDGMCLQCQLNASKAITNGLDCQRFIKKLNLNANKKGY